MRTGIYTIIISLLLAGMSAGQVTFKKERGGYTATATDKFEVTSGGELRMNDLEGDIRITGGSSSQVEVVQEIFIEAKDEAEAKEIFEEVRATIKKLGNTIEVSGTNGYGRERRGRGSHVYSIQEFGNHLTTFIQKGLGYNASYAVRVPMNFMVDASTNGGDVELNGLKGEAKLRTAGGDVDVTGVTGMSDVKTSGGDVTARNLEGSVELETAGGDVKISDSRKGPFRLETSGGDITVQTVKGEVRASTSGGDVEARDVEGELDLRTSGGDVTLINVKGPVHHASTSGGDVEARLVIGNVDLRTSGGMVTAKQVQGRVIGRTSGGDVEVNAITGETDVSTSGGDLDLDCMQGPVTGKTSGGDIRARIEKGGKLDGPIRLSTSGGEITIRLPADLQATLSARITLQDGYRGLNRLNDYSINCDFKTIKVNEESNRDKGSKRYREIVASGDINGGGLLIELETTNGDINIEKEN